MTDDPPDPMLVWDASALHPAAVIDRLDVLLDLATRGARRPCRHVTTAAVHEELSTHNLVLPPRLEIVHVDGLQEVVALSEWVDKMSARRHNRGEATVCAWAQVHGATAVLDDLAARRVSQKGGLHFHGSLW